MAELHQRKAGKKGLTTRRRKQILSCLELLTQTNSLLRIQSANQQLQKIVFNQVSQLIEEGFRQTTLCTQQNNCAFCQWAVTPICALCGKEFNRRKAANAQVYPLFIPKFTSYDSLLHIEVCLLCSEQCVNQMWDKTTNESSRPNKIHKLYSDSIWSMLLHMVMLLVSVYTIRWTHQLGLFTSQTVVLFTGWNMIAFFLYSFLTSVNHITPQRFLRWLSSVFFSITLLISISTAVVFWGLYFYDRELIHPKAFVFPAILNHLQHTVPAVLTLSELIFINPPYAISLTTDNVSTLLIPFLYLLGCYLLYIQLGIWPYPFMKNWSQQTFFLFSIGAITAATLLQFLIRLFRLYRL